MKFDGFMTVEIYHQTWGASKSLREFAAEDIDLPWNVWLHQYENSRGICQRHQVLNKASRGVKIAQLTIEHPANPQKSILYRDSFERVPPFLSLNFSPRYRNSICIGRLFHSVRCRTRFFEGVRKSCWPEYKASRCSLRGYKVSPKVGRASTQQTSHVPLSFQNILFQQNLLLIHRSLNVFSIDITLTAYLLPLLANFSLYHGPTTRSFGWRLSEAVSWTGSRSVVVVVTSKLKKSNGPEPSQLTALSPQLGPNSVCEAGKPKLRNKEALQLLSNVNLRCNSVRSALLILSLIYDELKRKLRKKQIYIK